MSRGEAQRDALELLPDDRATVEAQLVADYAPAMLAKLERARNKGRGGWEKPEECSVTHLWDLLHEHVSKPNLDMVDVGNIAAMVWHRLNHQPGEREQLETHVAAQAAANAELRARIRELEGLLTAIADKMDIDIEFQPLPEAAQ